MNTNQPIIIIGAGRSGTTLLSRIFSRHPDIDFRGETSFLLPRLWLELWDDRFWFNWEQYTRTNPRSVDDGFPEIPPDLLDAQQQHVGRMLAHIMLDLFTIDTHARAAWGFKEIWNGSNQFTYDWLPYDRAFSEALWVHLIRHPLQFAGSCAAWNKEPMTAAYLSDRLKDWCAIIRHSRLRETTGRYFEIRYEDLTADARTAVEPVLAKVQLAWHPACDDALSQHVLQSDPVHRTDGPTPDSSFELQHIMDAVDGLSHLMHELHYEIPSGSGLPLGSDRLQGEPRSSVDLHIQAPQLRQPHKPQIVLQRRYHELYQEHHKVLEQLHMVQRQYQSMLTSNTYVLAQKLQDSLLMKLWRWLHKV